MTLEFSYFSGLVCTVASMPLDIAKTRLQTMKPLADGAMPYRFVAPAVVSASRLLRRVCPAHCAAVVQGLARCSG
jgi:hypothetical protein